MKNALFLCAALLLTAVGYLLLHDDEAHNCCHATTQQELDYTALRTFKVENAAIDAEAAVKAKDFRLMAVNGVTVETPGVKGDISKQVTLRAEHGIKVIGGTSDTESGPQGVAFNNDARLYAKIYNGVILENKHIAAPASANAQDDPHIPPRFSDENSNALASAKEVILYSLDPELPEPQQVRFGEIETFHGWHVLGKAKLTGGHASMATSAVDAAP